MQLFNKNNNGAEELQELTGSYYANNEFNRIQTDVILTIDQIKKLVGNAVIERANDHYQSDDFETEGSSTEENQLNDQLVQHLRIPIAYHATHRYYQTNLVSHEDSGRKVKLDPENEKLPWEWMLDRDDDAQIRKANETTDRLIEFLEENQVDEWIESEQRKLTRKLFVNTVDIFHDSYPIDLSPRFYYTVTPFIHEAQTRIIKKALGSTYDDLLDYWKAFNTVEGSGSGSGSMGGIPAEPETNELYEELLEQVQLVIPFYAMIYAVKRLSLQVLPYGVVQNFKSMIQSRNSSQAAITEVIKMHISELKTDADYILDDIKKIIQASDPESLEYQFLPANDEDNKFFRT